MFAFGSGALVGYRTDVANGTPVNFGFIQDCSIDMSYDTKELYGQNQMPIAVARGKGSFKGKATLAAISGIVAASLFAGVNITAGQKATAWAEAATIPSPSGPYTVTVAQSATFLNDFGVVYRNTGLPLTKVASTPAAGQYAVSAGVYTFAAADAAALVLINYSYSIPSAGEQFTITNQLLGYTPTFSAMLYTTFQNKPVTALFPNCVPSKYTFPTKLDDFTLPDFEWTMFADAAGNVMYWSYGEAS